MKRTKSNQIRLTKLWRKHDYGRLYWHVKNRHWQYWETFNGRPAIAVAVDGTGRVWFATMDALEDEINQIKEISK